MSIYNPLTTSKIIQRSYISKSIALNSKVSLNPDLDVVAKDVVEISKLAIENQQKEVHLRKLKVLVTK